MCMCDVTVVTYSILFLQDLVEWDFSRTLARVLNTLILLSKARNDKAKIFFFYHSSRYEVNNWIKLLIVYCFLVFRKQLVANPCDARKNYLKKKNDHQALSFPPSCMYTELILVALKTTNKILIVQIKTHKPFSFLSKLKIVPTQNKGIIDSITSKLWAGQKRWIKKH